MRAVRIVDGQIRQTIVVGDDWTPPDAGWMPEVDALAAGIPRYELPVERQDATMFQVRVALARRGIDPDTLPALIDSLFPPGPERYEARARLAAPRVPFEHPLVPRISALLGIAPEEIWDEILTVEL